MLRRNRHHLKRTKETFTPYDDTDDYFDDDFTGDLADSQSSNEAPQLEEPLQVGERRSRYGRIIRLPVRYRND